MRRQHEVPAALVRRVAMLTGRRLTETADIAELWLAVSALELLTGESLVPPGADSHH
jgi:hypothetical protein